MSNVFSLDEIKKLMLDIAYPVGSYFISDKEENLSVQLGGGMGKIQR